MSSDIPDGYADDVTLSRRLAILRILRENEGAANESVLRSFLRALGFRGRLSAPDVVQKDAVFLEGAGLVTLERHHGLEASVLTLVITARGLAFVRREAEPIRGIQYPDVA